MLEKFCSTRGCVEYWEFVVLGTAVVGLFSRVDMTRKSLDVERNGANFFE